MTHQLLELVRGKKKNSLFLSLYSTCVLITFHMPGCLPGTGKSSMINTDMVPVFKELVRETDI
jgi:hypothetical protein